MVRFVLNLNGMLLRAKPNEILIEPNLLQQARPFQLLHLLPRRLSALHPSPNEPIIKPTQNHIDFSRPIPHKKADFSVWLLGKILLVIISSQFGMNTPGKNRTIECYQIIETIGKGANGLVYKGINLNNGMFVAMKEMPISKEEVKAIKKEINFIKNLNHRNIVKYFDAVVKDHRIYLILEYLEGGSLGTLCRRSIFPESLIKLYIFQILQGLEYLHKLNILHRDIKGLNILMTKDGKIKIADFGVAVNVNENQKTLSAGGTPYWMAPETANGQDFVSTKSDIWSLGCTLIELMTGNPPYHELSPLPALIRIVQDQHPPLPKNASPECIDFLLRCFQKNPQKRANATELLQHRWVRSITQQQLNLQKSHKNIRSSNVMLIETTLRSYNLREIHSLVLKTQNKKLIYFNKNFLVLNEIENCDLKLDVIAALVDSSFEAYKYLEEVGVMKNLFTCECKTVKINPAKALELIGECYRLGFEKDVFYMIQNNVIFYLSMLCKQYLTKKENYLSHLPIIERLCPLLRIFTHDQIVLPCHLLQILEEENTLSALSTAYLFAADCKQVDIAFAVLQILNRYTEQLFEQSKATAIFGVSFQKLCNITIFQNDIKTCEQNLKLILFLSKYEQFQEKMDAIGFINYLSEYAKLLVLNKNVCDDHTEVVLLYLECILQYISGKPQKCKTFQKVGGVKRLKSLPKFFLENPDIVNKINQIMNQINNSG